MLALSVTFVLNFGVTMIPGKNNPGRKSLFWILLLTVFTLFPVFSTAADDPNATWDAGLRQHYFSDKTIFETGEVVELDAPVRAENGAIVPIKIFSKFPQSEERFIKTITLLIDENPVPWAGTFHFTPRSGRADLDLRIRVNSYSNVRAIAETNDGELHMATRFVKASGGCSAPVGTDLEAAMARLGKMKFRTKSEQGLSEPLQAQLAISHPNVTGMQMDQVTRMYAPAHFVKEVKISFKGELIFSAETDISISENPNFKFFFIPQEEGELIAEVTDSNGLQFSQVYEVNDRSVLEKITDQVSEDTNQEKI